MNNSQPFNETWKKQVMKLPIKYIEEIFDTKHDGKLKKVDWVDLIRSQLIVATFNKRYSIGDALFWKADINDEHPLRVTVKTRAFMHYGTPVVLFFERPAICTIEPEHIM